MRVRRTTGIALVQVNKVIWGAELTHRGFAIREKLESRRQLRRSRRNRKTRYRQPRFLNRARQSGWLAPSLQHRVDTTVTWVKRLMKYARVVSLKSWLSSICKPCKILRLMGLSSNRELCLATNCVNTCWKNGNANVHTVASRTASYRLSILCLAARVAVTAHLTWRWLARNATRRRGLKILKISSRKSQMYLRKCWRKPKNL